MSDDVIIELSILIDNGLIDQFEEFDVPSILSPTFILEGVLKPIGRLLKAREDLKAVSKLIGALKRLIRRIDESSISRFKMGKYNVSFVYLPMDNFLIIGNYFSHCLRV
jgi:hypothetical protein